ncbi:hypothetical protein ABE208_21350 [Bacillus inaquosorum]|uniref:hypothetical protein n=1 Tax=Bacillus inaquosorum TaxID=483913 RepID=UPI003D221FE6
MTDFERKVYHIIVNMHLYGKNPTLNDLKRKTGKNEEDIHATVKLMLILQYGCQRATAILLSTR